MNNPKKVLEIYNKLVRERLFETALGVSDRRSCRNICDVPGDCQGGYSSDTGAAFCAWKKQMKKKD